MITVVDRINRHDAGLLPGKLKMKYRLMDKSIYGFMRGTCHLFYERLSKEKKFPSSPTAWLCGDLHLENFGSYKGDNRLVYFDLNDFDEAILGPAAWELVRCLSSIFVAFEHWKIERKKAENMAALYLKVYSDTLARGKSFYVEPQTARGIVCDFLTHVSKRKQRDLIDRITYKSGRKRLLINSKKLLPIAKAEKKKLRAHMNEWISTTGAHPYNYEVVDVVFRVAGLGSLGLRRYLFLLRSNNVKEKYLLMDMKQSRKSCLKPYIKLQQPHWHSEAERIISVQERMQNITPFLLSTISFEGESYVLQELQPTKDNINLKSIKDHYRDIYQTISDMALLTASAQLRSAGRQGAGTPDELILFGQNTDWQQPLIDYAVKMAEVTREQYEEFRARNEK